MQELTALQEEVENRLSTLLSRHDRSVDSREVLEAQVPFYSKQPFGVLKIKSQDLEVWIYDNELSFTSRSGGGGLELAGYRNREDFVEAVLAKIAAAL